MEPDGLQTRGPKGDVTFATVQPGTPLLFARSADCCLHLRSSVKSEVKFSKKPSKCQPRMEPMDTDEVRK